MLSCEMSENPGPEPVTERKGGLKSEESSSGERALSNNFLISMIQEFQQEFPKFWKALPHKLLFGILLVAWVALFHFWGNSSFGYYVTRSMFVLLNTVYTQFTDDQHGQIVPLLVLVLMWIKREELLSAAKNTWWPALGLLIFAVVLHIVGYAVQQVRVSVIAFIIGLYALTGVVWGRTWMACTFFPMFLLFFCIPMATLFEAITFPLRLIVTKISVGIANTGLGIEVMSAGSQILDTKGRPLYDVAPACSGMRSLVAMGLITFIYSFLSFKTNWRRAIIIASALPFAVLGNVARITTVIIVGDAFGKEAGAKIEQNLGFLTFAVAIGCMLGVGWLLRENRKPAAPPAPLPMETNPA